MKKIHLVKDNLHSGFIKDKPSVKETSNPDRG